MKILLCFLLFLYVVFYGTWIFYVAFMNIKRHMDFLKSEIPVVWYGLIPFFIIAILMDILFNFTVGTIYYREIPKEFLFTARCHRHLTTSSGIQLMRANFVCSKLLDPFEQDHCL